MRISDWSSDVCSSDLETPDPRLRTISTPVEAVDDELRRLMDDMLETMYDAPGIGLAAIQVGVPKRVLVIDLQDEDPETGERQRAPMFFVNPEIVEESDEQSVYSEGCLSVPEMFADVERPAAIRARGLDYEGVAHDERLDGLFAPRSEEHTSELQSLMRSSYAVFCLKKKTKNNQHTHTQ